MHVLLSPLFVRVVFNDPERSAEIFWLLIDDGRRTGSTRVAFVSSLSAGSDGREVVEMMMDWRR